jgi:tryptophan synthase alpha chain
MSAIDDLFRRLRGEGRKAFMPFVTAGDPDLSFTTAVIRELAARGSDLCELGIPYSDPIADGPVVQSSFTRALEQGLTLPAIFDEAPNMMAGHSMPLVTMVSYSIIFRQGLEKYVASIKKAGFAGAIVPDLSLEEAPPLAEICRREDISLIRLVTPTSSRDRALRIIESSTGFVYYVSVAGITGERTALPSELVDDVAQLREQTDLPICIGFGISRPEHIRLLAPVADGLIVGSAIVRRIAETGAHDRSDVLRDVGDYAQELISTLRETETAGL